MRESESAKETNTSKRHGSIIGGKQSRHSTGLEVREFFCAKAFSFLVFARKRSTKVRRGTLEKISQE
jgi:hypothetical protein